MIKARAGNLVIIGLSDENLDKLRDDKPIKFNAGELGLNDDLDIIIFNGRTEKEMAEMVMKRFNYKAN